MGNLADLNVSIGADVKPLQAGLDQAKASLTTFANTGAAGLSKTATASITAATDVKSLTAAIRLLGSEQSKVLPSNIEQFFAYQRAIDIAKEKLKQLQAVEKSQIVTENAVTVANQKVAASNIEVAASSSKLTSGLSSLSKGFSIVKQAAFLLPGIGIAGIFNLAFEGIMQAVSALGLFTSDADKAAQAQSGLSDVTRTLVTENERFSNQLKETVESLSQESVKVNDIFSALSSSNTSLGQRKTLIGELIQLSPAYFGSLNKEKASYDEISKAVDAYNSNLGKTTVIKSLLPNFERIVQPLIAARAELFKQQSGLGLFGVSDEEMKAEEDRLKAEVAKQEKLVAQAQKGFETIAGGALNLQQILFGKTDTAEKTTSSVKTISDVLEDLRNKLSLISSEESVFGKNMNPERISAIKSALTSLLSIGTDAQSPVVQGLILQIDELRQKIDAAKLQLVSLGGTPGAKLANPIQQQTPIVPLVGLGDEANNKVKKNFEKAGLLAQQEIAKLQKVLQDAVNNMFQSVFEGIGEGLGNALTGKGNPFASLGKILGDGIKALGSQLIKLGIASEVIQKALKNPFGISNPFLLIGGGIALQAIGSAIGNLGITPHAEGGIFTKPTLIGSHLFGEKGPEALVPLSRMNEFGAGGNGQHIEVSGSIQLGYNGLLIAIERATRNTNRNYGNFGR